MPEFTAPDGDSLEEVNHCHGPGKGHPCKAGEGKAAEKAEKQGQQKDPLSYESLVEKGWKVTKGEAAIIMKRSAAAQKALDALKAATDAEEHSFGDDIKVVNKAMRILRARVLPRALLKIQEDEEPLFFD
jgi:hypothetical protein